MKKISFKKTSVRIPENSIHLNIPCNVKYIPIPLISFIYYAITFITPFFTKKIKKTHMTPKSSIGNPKSRSAVPHSRVITYVSSILPYLTCNIAHVTINTPQQKG